MHLLEPGHDGYAALESNERVKTRKTLEGFPELVETWLTALDVYFAVMKEVRDLTDVDGDAKFALVTRLTFFGLGLGHSKAALDAVCRADYHHAYFSFRYVAELFMQAMYLRFRPDEARRWHPQHASGTAPVYEPKFERIFSRIKSYLTPDDEAERAAVDLVHDLAKDMDASGAHPSHEVLAQALVQVEDRVQMGPRFDSSRCLGALDRGLLLTLLLLAEMVQDETTAREQRTKQVEALFNTRQTLMQPHWDRA